MGSVWFYIPNLIGYSRIIFAALAFYYYQDFWFFFVFYALSAILDMADGYAARLLDQCSKFGAVLDMVTDRASTTCLTGILCHFYPQYMNLWLFLMANDALSHYAHIYSSLSRGSSHKVMKKDVSPFLRLYYENRFVLAFLCGGNEAFFLFSYLLHFYSGPLLPFILPGFGQISLVQFILFFIATPIMSVKQTINLIQLSQACIDMVELDELDKKTKQK